MLSSGNMYGTIQTANTSDFKSYGIPHLQGLVPYIFSDENIKL